MYNTLQVYYIGKLKKRMDLSTDRYVRRREMRYPKPTNIK